MVPRTALRRALVALLAALPGIALAGPPVPERAADETLEGQLAEGQVLDNAWASRSNVACFPGTMASYFAGKQTFFVLQQEPSQDLVVRVTPKAGSDVSVYALQLGGAMVGARPPEVTQAWRCTPAYANKGAAAETLKLVGHKSAMEIVLAVVGADPASEGAFTVEIWRETGRF